MKILVTGGCGFIGSNFVRHLLATYPDYTVVNLDAVTYAGNPENLRDVSENARYTFHQGRIEDPGLLKEVMTDIDCVVHFAAESHVDRSILDAQPFLKTNVIGTYLLLEAARDSSVRRFLHVSTDEVYGTLGDDGKFTEETALSPNSPYAASKASGDMLVRAFHETFRFPAVIVRPSNNYGPYQFPEKFIPLMITNLMEAKPIPVYGEGKNVRDWLYVEDTCRAVDVILHRGKDGEIYNVGGNSEQRNIEIVGKVLAMTGKDERFVTYVKDRPGHDYRYALDNAKIERELGWKPTVDVDTGLRKTIQWYEKNEWWWKPLKGRLASESKGFWTKGQ